MDTGFRKTSCAKQQRQANNDKGRADAQPDIRDFLKRYPKAAARDFDGNPAKITELDALVAYLQMLGTLVDFQLYDDKANVR